MFLGRRDRVELAGAKTRQICLFKRKEGGGTGGAETVLKIYETLTKSKFSCACMQIHFGMFVTCIMIFDFLLNLDNHACMCI